MLNKKVFLHFILVGVVLYSYSLYHESHKITIVEPQTESKKVINYMPENEVVRNIGSFEKNKDNMETINRIARALYEKNKGKGWNVAVDAAYTVFNNSDEIFTVDIIMSQLDSESHYQYNLVSSANAIGIAQIQPETGRWIANKMAFVEWNEESLYNPSYNINLAVAYMRYLYKEFGGNVHAALTAYNRGVYGAERYEANRGTFHSGYSEEVISRSGVRRFSK